MKINLPFEPGHCFWSPRVFCRNERVTIVHEGHEYSRYDDTLEILARHKRITQVEVKINEDGETTIRYWGVTVGKTDAYHSLVNPESGFSTEAAALDFARHWRNTQQTEYFGQGDFEDPDEDTNGD